MNQAQRMLRTAEKYNRSEDFLRDIYGLSKDERFDAYVIGPSWTPEKILKNTDAEVECVVRHTYFSSYRVRYAAYSIGWLQCAAGAGNLIDTVLCLADTEVNKVIFIGAVGALKEGIRLGEIATPQESLSFDGASRYLFDDLMEDRQGEPVVPHNETFIRRVIEEAKGIGIDITRRKVFCTDSILCEYTHLDFIHGSGAELIEMETSAFYRCTKRMEKDGIALLVVSDNSASGISLVARSDEETRVFHQARETYLPKLIRMICGM